jgi:hypothetical protein
MSKRIIDLYVVIFQAKTIVLYKNKESKYKIMYVEYFKHNIKYTYWSTWNLSLRTNTILINYITN